MTATEAQALRGLSDAACDFMLNFWGGLQATPYVCACPLCSAPDLPVKETVYAARRWRYVLHCRSVRVVGHPVRVGGYGR